MKHRRLHSFRVIQPALAAAALLCLALSGLPVAATPPNQPPQLSPISDRTINEGSVLIFSASATDPDVPTQTLTFTLDAGAPEGAAISTSGLFTWTPTEPQGPGTYKLSVIVTDSGTPSLTATQSFNVTVQEVNLAPTLGGGITDRTVNEGELLTFTATATDPDLPAQTLTFTLGAGAPTGASVDPTTGVFTWTPSELQGPGTYFLSIFVTDSGTPAQNDARGFHVTVLEVNRPPELPALSDLTVNEGTFIGFSASPSDPDIPAQTVTVTLGPGAPAGASISPGGFFIWSPSEAQGPSTNRIAIIATDNGTPSLSTTQFFTAIILEVNQAPALNLIPDQTIVESNLLTFTAAATDPDLPAQTLRFTLGAGAPPGASIDPNTGVFTWTPTETQGPGTYVLSVVVTDNAASPQSASRTFNVTVQEANLPPVMSPIDDRTIVEGSVLIFNVPATDPDTPTQTLTFTLGPGAPAGAAVSPSGLFTWTPTSNQGPSTNRIAVIVADNGTPSLTATQMFTVIVLDLNAAPALAVIPDQTISEGQLLTFTASATDPDQPAQTLTFSLGGGAPPGAAIDANSGVFTWIPTEAQGPATNAITVTVADSGTPPLTASRRFNVVVQEVNSPPVIAPIDDRAVNSGTVMIFPVTASDSDIPGQTLTFNLGPGAPAGASITAGGLFTWTPTAAQSPSTNIIAVIVADNGTPSLTATQRFAAIVTDLNRAPSLAAIPDQTVNEGELLTFTASATDSDQPAQTLTFSLGAGALPGAAIDAGTGVFTWTPTEVQGPATNVITIIVTDNGTPALSAARGVNVIVKEVNRRPEVDPIADQVANAGGLLVFSVFFHDPDVPVQPVSITLGPGAPAGAAISPGGLFSWTPTAAEAPSTNSISVIASDGSLTATQRFTVVVQGINHAPVLPAIADQAVNEGELLTFTASASDPDQPLQTLVFSLGAGALPGAAIDPNTGVFTWTPTEVQGPATNVITVVVTDNGTPPLTAARGVTVVVNEVNRPPELDPIADQVINVGGFLVFGVTFRDPDVPVQPVTLTLGPGAPTGAAISTGGLFTWTPTAAQAPSTNKISVIASDNATPSLSATQRFTVIVQGINHAPTLAAIPDKTVNEGELLTFTASASDPEQPLQTLTFSLGAGAPDGVAIDPSTGVFTWTPSELQGPATNVITVIVTDSGTPALTASRSVNVVVNEINRPPEVDPIADQATGVGAVLVVSVLFRDRDIPIQALTATLGPGAPAGAAITSGGLFTWTPTAAQAPSTNSIAVIVTDNGTPSLSATQHFTVTVHGFNRAPVIEPIPNQTVNEGELLTFTASASDPDQPTQTLTFSIGSGAPEGAVINPTTGVFTWTPAEIEGPATNVINVIVTDNGGPPLSASRSVTIVVNEVNRPPELDPIADRTASVGGVLIFGVTYRDPDIPVQPLITSLGPGAPQGAAISAGGLFTWTPTPAQASSVSTISVIVSDNAVPSLTATQRFTVTVGAFNRPPVLETIPDQTVNEGELLTFIIIATDPEQPAQTLTYALGPGAPVGASLNPVTGVFTWIPNELEGPETNTFSVLVTDNGSPPLSVSGNFHVVVNEVNQPPFFLPDTNLIVNVGSPLIFSVEADDLDIPFTILSYSLGPGAPAGASITPRGEFSWRPAAGQGPSNYFVSVIVNDNGVPPLRATNIVEIDVIVGAPLTAPVLRTPTWRTNNVFTSTIDMIAGRRYTLEGSDSANPPNWRAVEAFQGRGVPDEMTDSSATNRTRMYRARVE